MKVRLGFIAIALGMILVPAGHQRAVAEPAFPAAALTSLPPVAQGRRLLEAIATNNDAEFLRTLHGLYPTSKMTDAEWLDVRPNWKAFTFHGVEKATATDAELSVFDGARDTWAKIVVSVDGKPPYAITDFGVRAGRRPSDVPAALKLAPDALLAAVRDKASSEAAADHFSGVVMIERNERAILQQGYGLADRAKGEPVRLKTKFRIGSMGKMFTTVAILQLAESGKLDLKAPIARYLADFPNREIATTVTVDELLNRAGGTGDFFGPEFDAHRNELIDPKDYVAMFGRRPALFPAGTRQAYSNFGFIILGRIVETVSGEPYDQYVERHIFRPAKMTGSGYLPETLSVPGRAIGYTQSATGLVPATKDQVYRGTPAGGSYSTGPDMIRFAEALMAGRLLNADYLKLLVSTGTTLPNGVKSFFDFGGHHTNDGLLFYGHGGAASGQNGVLHIFPESGYVVVVLANRDPNIAERIASFTEARIP